MDCQVGCQCLLIPRHHHYVLSTEDSQCAKGPGFQAMSQFCVENSHLPFHSWFGDFHVRVATLLLMVSLWILLSSLFLFEQRDSSPHPSVLHFQVGSFSLWISHFLRLPLSASSFDSWDAWYMRWSINKEAVLRISQTAIRRRILQYYQQRVELMRRRIPPHTDQAPRTELPRSADRKDLESALFVFWNSDFVGCERTRLSRAVLRSLTWRLQCHSEMHFAEDSCQSLSGDEGAARCGLSRHLQPLDFLVEGLQALPLSLCRWVFTIS